jgi:ATPases involved in chromosome partitioning
MLRRDESFDRSPSIAVLKDVFKHRRVTIAVVTVVVFGASLAFSFSRMPIYTASSSVLVQTPLGSTVAPNMDTEKKLADSTAVAEIVARRAGVGRDPHDLLESLSISVPVGTEILVISYSSPNRYVAQAGAEGFADAYLAFRQQQLVGETISTRTALQEQITGFTKQLSQVERRAAHGANASVTSAEASSLTTLIAGAEQRLESLTPASVVSAGQVVDAATVPTSPARPSHPIDGVLGLLVGLILGTLVGWIRERWDDRVRDAEDAELILGAPVVGTVPTGNLLAALKTPYDERIRSANQVRRMLAKLRAELMLRAGDATKSFLLTTCAADAAPIAAALATSLARGGKSVVVVSTDNEDRSLDAQFGTADEVGLTEVLAGGHVAGVLRPGPEPGIRILPTGSANLFTAEMLVSKTMATMVQELGRLADIVLISVGPVVQAPETAVVASMCDVALVVVGPRATRTELSEVHGALSRGDGVLLGAVLVDRHLKSLPAVLEITDSALVKSNTSSTIEVAS